MLAENNNIFTNYEFHTATPSGTDGVITFSGTIYGLRITNDGPGDVDIAINTATGGINTNIPVKASQIFSENIATSDLHYVLASGSSSASLRILGLK